MKKFRALGVLAASLLLTCAAPTVHATGWYGTTIGTPYDLYGIDCSSSTHCIAVGDGGTVMYTSTSLDSWTEGSSTVGVVLNDVDVYSSVLAYAVGENGTIIKSTDGGATWTEVHSSGIDPLYDVVAVSTTVAWAVGEDTHIFKTTDAGATWTDVGSATGGIDARSIDAVSSSVLWITGTHGEVLKTTNGGTTWTSVAVPAAASQTLWTVEAFTSSAALVGGDGPSLYKTTDGGTTWTALTLDGFGASEVVSDISMKTTSVGTVIGNAGTINSTEDGTTFTEDAAIDTIDGAYDLMVYAVGARVIVGSATVGLLYDNSEPAAPTNLAMSGGTSTTDTTPSFTWDDVTDDGSGLADYEVSVDSGTWTSTSATASYTSSALSTGSHTIDVRAIDAVDNVGAEASLSFTITASSSSSSSSSDTTAPTVGRISSSTATEDVAKTLSVTYSDDVAVTSCTLYINGSAEGTMTLSGGTATRSFIFATAGSHTAYVTCEDAAGNIGTGSERTITVSATSSSSSSSTTEEASAGDLIKLACTSDDDVNDPCRAVYYLGNDGKRHAFPNEKVYFTWYDDFDSVVIVSSEYMASLTLGHNVTYHPGSRLVKFVTVRTVYAVDSDGLLRGITSEDVASSIWGDTWNQQVDDISDAFFSNYSYGAVIDSTSDFDPDTVEASVDSIDDIL